MEQKASILICGPVGVGKTFIAQALGYQVLFAKTGRVLADLEGGHAEGAFENRLKWCDPHFIPERGGTTPFGNPATSCSWSTHTQTNIRTA